MITACAKALEWEEEAKSVKRTGRKEKGNKRGWEGSKEMCVGRCGTRVHSHWGRVSTLEPPFRPLEINRPSSAGTEGNLHPVVSNRGTQAGPWCAAKARWLESCPSALQPALTSSSPLWPLLWPPTCPGSRRPSGAGRLHLRPDASGVTPTPLLVGPSPAGLRGGTEGTGHSSEDK